MYNEKNVAYSLALKLDLRAFLAKFERSKFSLNRNAVAISGFRLFTKIEDKKY